MSSQSAETRCTTDELLDALSDEQRRSVLHVLGDTRGELSIDELTSEIHERGLNGGDRDGEGSRRSTATALRHVHLPKLDDVGLADFDPDARRVSPPDGRALGGESEGSWTEDLLGLAGRADSPAVDTSDEPREGGDRGDRPTEPGDAR